jgi:hypothetical protein
LNRACIFRPEEREIVIFKDPNFEHLFKEAALKSKHDPNYEFQDAPTEVSNSMRKPDLSAPPQVKPVFMIQPTYKKPEALSQKRSLPSLRNAAATQPPLK